MLRRKINRRRLREAFISGYKKALKERRLVSEGLNQRIEENIAREVTHLFSVSLSNGLRYITMDKGRKEPESVEEFVDVLLPSGTTALDEYLEDAYNKMLRLTPGVSLDFDYSGSIDRGVRSAISEYIEDISDDWFMWRLSRSPNAGQRKQDFYNALLRRLRDIVEDYINRRSRRH